MLTYRKFPAFIVAAFTVAVLAACGGGGGGGGDTPAPAAGEITISGAVTASNQSYFSGSAGVASTSRMHALRVKRAAEAPSWNCDSAYQTAFAGKQKNVDHNGDGSPDLNVTDAAGVVTYSVDTTGAGEAAINIGTAGQVQLRNKDTDCDTVADINIDADKDGVAEKFVDADGDDQPDYSVVDASVVSVIGANVKLTRRDTGEVVDAATDRDGKFKTKLKTGDYDVETRGHGADGATLWAHKRGKHLGIDGDLGEFGLHRNPLLRDVYIDGTQVATALMESTYNASPKRSVTVGDVVEIRVVAEDPNGKPISVRAFAHLGAGYTELPVAGDTVRYTLAQSDLVLSSLQLLVELNNDDGIKGADAYRDMLVNVTYQVAGTPTLPALDGIRVNGTTYANDNPASAMSLTAPAVQPGASTTIETLFDASAAGHPGVSTEYYDASAGGMQHVAGGPVTIPGSATVGVYNVKATVTLFLADFGSVGSFSTVTLPVATTDKPAAIDSLLVNGAAPAGRVFRVGDTLGITANVSDPAGRPVECMFAVLGGAPIQSAWQPCSGFTYTVTQADVSASFRIRVWARNDDGRVLDGAAQYDSTQTYGLTTSE